jgi:hypothetical protein
MFIPLSFRRKLTAPIIEDKATLSLVKNIAQGRWMCWAGTGSPAQRARIFQNFIACLR